MSNTYRDDREAAHALAEALQRENAELRSELARVKDGDFGSTFAPPPTASSQLHPEHGTRSLTVVMSVMILAFGAVGTAVAMHPTQITVVAPQPEAPALPPPLRVEAHTPATGRFVPRPPGPTLNIPASSDVFMAIHSARPDVASCFPVRWGFTTATIEFSHDGTVNEVRFSPPSAEDACLEAAVRRIRLPPFNSPSWTLVQSFQGYYRR